MTWIVASFAVLLAALLAGFAWYERTQPTARVIALVATLAALAALGRVAFAPLPSVKPTTDVVLIAGFVLGGAPGFVVGAVAALASNLFFGQGPWTPWQMVAWGSVGLGGALLARLAGRELGRIALAAACGAAALGYGLVMNLHLWVMYSGDHTLAKLLAVLVTSLPFDLVHAGASVAFCLAFGPALVRALARYRTRFEVTWQPAAGVAAAAALALVLVAAPAARAQEANAAAARASERYLLDAQNADGGWGAAPGQASSPLYSGWAALGLAGVGRVPDSALAYVRADRPGDLGEVARTALVLAAEGKDTDGLEARLVEAQQRSGAWAGRVNTTAFAVLALRGAGRSTGSRAVARGTAWLARQGNRDGGFNFGGRGAPSGVDDTGAAVQALVAGGRRRGRAVRRAVSFLVREQNADGGFSLVPGAASNAQSTAWAVQALDAAGRDPARVRRNGSRDPLAYLRSLTAGSGEVRYSRTSRQTPVWVTAQVVLALAREPLPLPRPKPERRRRATASAAATADAPAPVATPAAERARVRRERRERRPQSLPAVGRPEKPRLPPALVAAVTATTSPLHARTAGAVTALAVTTVG